MMPRVVLAAALVAALFLIANAHAADPSIAELRKKVCNSDSDCVRLVGGSGQMILDGLDFQKDTVATIRSRCPSWFGPARPIVFTINGRIERDETSPLSSLGVKIGTLVRVISAGDADSYEL